MVRDFLLFLRVLLKQLFCKCEKVEYIKTLHGDYINAVSWKYLYRGEWKCLKCGKYHYSGMWLSRPGFIISRKKLRELEKQKIKEKELKEDDDKWYYVM